ncbi:MAG: ATPase BadF/BadG/BcrA/BcrD type, partial [Actinoallomurus sp.]|nr:ATPase BadF/BadG/BcrA/BcrD type [Actinoallomurus sp.]
ATAACRAAGISGEPDVVTDIAVAFAAGTAEPAGIVIFAGTGAGAAVINDGAIERRADGYGWLVGDEGSAVWMGREAVRAALRAYDGRGTPTVLAQSVPRAMLGEAAEPLLADLSDLGTAPSRSALPQAVVKEVYGRPPAALGELAPLVSSAAEAGDAVARHIVEEAAQSLLSDVDAVTPALTGLTRPGEGRNGDAAGGPGHGFVVAGSLLEQGPVADAVRAGLRSRFGTDPVPARDGALGAARLAIRRLSL